MLDANGRRPVYGGTAKFQDDPHWRDLILFYEYSHTVTTELGSAPATRKPGNRGRHRVLAPYFRLFFNHAPGATAVTPSARSSSCRGVLGA